ncbi:MAG: hypothetical protein GX575_02995 [Candidatus Anammoximicrobium sp.]|nr:hypothetical protein [Candidatus Anammoximicrobium sp.]
MNGVSCPFCGAGQSLPHSAAGQIARCKSCGKTFMVPHLRPPQMAAPPDRPASAMPRTGASPAPVRPAPVCVPAPVPVPASVTRDPQAAESPEAAEPQDAGVSPIGLILFGGTACFILGALLLLVVILKLAQRSRVPDRPTAAGVPSAAASRIVHWTPEASRSSGWSSVARGVAIALNSLAVDVHYVGYGEVRARDARNRVVVSDENNYLQVYLKIRNLGAEPVHYVSWLCPSFAAGGQQVQATLVDDQGRSYAMQEFAQVAGLQGHTPQAVLAHKEEAEDVVVFIVPTSVDRRAIRHFRLELPAEAYGGSGVYRFEIPPETIQGFP